MHSGSSHILRVTLSFGTGPVLHDEIITWPGRPMSVIEGLVTDLLNNTIPMIHRCT